MKLDLTIPATLPTVPLENLIAEAQAIEAVNKECAEAISGILHDIIAFERAAEAQFRSIKDPINQAAQAADRLWRPTRDMCEAGKALCKRKIGEYVEAEQRRRLALDAQRREAARKEQERIQLEAAEREERGRAEAQRLREQAEAQAAAGNTASAAELKAGAERAEMGAQQDAQLMLEQAQAVIPLELPDEPKVQGVIPRKVWGWEGLDLMETVKAVAEGRAPLKVLCWNEPVLRQMSGALKESFSVPGCVAKPEQSVAARR